MVSEHLQTAEESSENLLTEKTKTGQSTTSAAQEPLLEHCREHSLPLLHCVIRKLYGGQLEGPSLGGENSAMGHTLDSVYINQLHWNKDHQCSCNPNGTFSTQPRNSCTAHSTHMLLLFPRAVASINPLPPKTHTHRDCQLMSNPCNTDMKHPQTCTCLCATIIINDNQ